MTTPTEGVNGSLRVLSVPVMFCLCLSQCSHMALWCVQGFASELLGEVFTKGKGPFGQIGVPLGQPLNAEYAGVALAVWVSSSTPSSLEQLEPVDTLLHCSASHRSCGVTNLRPCSPCHILLTRLVRNGFESRGQRFG